MNEYVNLGVYVGEETDGRVKKTATSYTDCKGCRERKKKRTLCRHEVNRERKLKENLDNFIKSSHMVSDNRLSFMGLHEIVSKNINSSLI